MTVYLDHNGTTPVAPRVADAMWPYLTEQFGNPSSATPQGRLARQAVGAREQVAVTSVVEHPASVQPLRRLETLGWTAHRLSVDTAGRIDPATTPSSPIGLGTLILAQNEVITIQPVAG